VTTRNFAHGGSPVAEDVSSILDVRTNADAEGLDHLEPSARTSRRGRSTYPWVCSTAVSQTIWLTARSIGAGASLRLTLALTVRPMTPS